MLPSSQMPTSPLLEAERRQRVTAYMHTGTLPAWISQIPLAAAAGIVCTGVGHGKPARSTCSCIFLATARADPPGALQQDATGLYIHSLKSPAGEGLRRARGGCTRVTSRGVPKCARTTCRGRGSWWAQHRAPQACQRAQA